MSRLAFVGLAGSLMVASVALAHPEDQPVLSGAGPPKTEEVSQNEQGVATVSGRIVSIDFSLGILTLDNGAEFRIPPTLQPTSVPAIGEQVEVVLTERGGEMEALSIIGTPSDEVLQPEE